MPTLKLYTQIEAPAERVFDLARSIDLHTASTSKTHERAVAGRTTGLIKRGETVTWEAIHFGIKQKLTSIITDMERPYLFEDKMVEGIFQSMTHRHTFQEQKDRTLMTDEFNYRAPLWILGRLAEFFFLTRYMRKFLEERNSIIKQLAESNGWKKYLSS